MTEDNRIEQIRAVLSDPMLGEAMMLDQVNAILDSAPPDSETEWGLRYPSGLLFEPYASREAAEDSVRPGAVLVRREVGPWIEARRG